MTPSGPPPAESRDAFLDACPSDADMLAFAEGRLESDRLAALDEHVDQCATCQTLLCEAAHALETAATSPSPGADDVPWNCTFASGALVAQRYVIQRFVARGGMGEVYEAFDRDLNERVALKAICSTACDSPTAIRRLKAEVQLARRVSHPNVCRIYDLGTHSVAHSNASIHFLTMEFVEGETLGQRIRLGGPCPVDEAVDIAKGLLRGLSAAHAAGVLHRDFKSDNVMLKFDGGGRETPVILDFGLARALDEERRGLTSESHPHLLGTFDYMAPEQLEGRPHSPLGDIYGFGVVLYEMLTGQLPFEGGNKAAVALERLRREPPPPSQRNAAIPPALNAIVLGCLRRQPAQRYASADEVRECLEQLTAQALAPPRRGPIATRAAIAALLLTVLAVPVLVAGTRPSTQPRLDVSNALPASSAQSAMRVGDQSFIGLVAKQGIDVSAARMPALQPSGAPNPVRRSPRRTASPVPTPASAPVAAPSASAAPLPSVAPSVSPPTPAAPRGKPDWENPFPDLTQRAGP